MTKFFPLMRDAQSLPPSRLHYPLIYGWVNCLVRLYGSFGCLLAGGFLIGLPMRFSDISESSQLMGFGFCLLILGVAGLGSILYQIRHPTCCLKSRRRTVVWIASSAALITVLALGSGLTYNNQFSDLLQLSNGKANLLKGLIPGLTVGSQFRIGVRAYEIMAYWWFGKPPSTKLLRSAS